MALHFRRRRDDAQQFGRTDRTDDDPERSPSASCGPSRPGVPLALVIVVPFARQPVTPDLASVEPVNDRKAAFATCLRLNISVIRAIIIAPNRPRRKTVIEASCHCGAVKNAGRQAAAAADVLQLFDLPSPGRAYGPTIARTRLSSWPAPERPCPTFRATARWRCTIARHAAASRTGKASKREARNGWR